MPGEWQVRPLGDLTENFDNVRVPVKESDRRPGPFPYYGASGIVDYVDQYLFDGEYLLVAEDGENLRTRNTPVAFLARGRFWVNNHAHIVRGNRNADTRFLVYALKAAEIDGYLTGSTMPKLTQGNLNRIPVLVPPLREQRAIARILSALDDKIELNRQINETLEAMARALFKSWFVDFDPVRAKAEGRDPGLPARVAAPLPASFVDSEFGEIPQGWVMGSLEDVLRELVTGARPTGGAVREGVPSIGAENVIGLGRYDFSKEKFVPRDFFEYLKLRGAALEHGDVLLYKDGAQIGRKTYFDCAFPHSECSVNEHVFIVRARRREQQRYVFFWLDQTWMTQEIIALNSNSAQPGINQTGVRGLPILLPPSGLISYFDDTVAPLTRRLFANCIQSQSLGAIRDALLPKLLSGEIRVKDAEKPVEAVLAQA
jgi:type I restriction enzyme, S subunit